MNTFRNLRISRKLALSFGLVLTITALLGLFSLAKLSQFNDDTVEVTDVWLDGVHYISDANTRASDVRRYELGFIIAPPSEYASYEKGLADSEQKLQQNISEYKKALQENEKALLAEFEQKWAEYSQVHEKVLRLARTGKKSEAYETAIMEGKPIFNAANSALEQLLAMDAKGGDEAAVRSRNSYTSARGWLIAILVAAILAGIFLATFVSRAIANPLGKAADRIRAAEQANDLATQLDVDGTDEVGQICASFNSFLNKLREAVSEVAQSTEHIASATEEISSSSTQAASGAETQKDQTNQVATAMQEMSSTVLQVSENSNKAAESAKRAGEIAKNGGEIVTDTVDVIQSLANATRDTASKIQELGKSSDQIGQIIGVIDDIADQTNLLALNAAIEAARAGEQGRGFAVVADEVRKLAERTTQATKEIAQMIKTIQEETQRAVESMESGTQNVENGVLSAKKAGDALREIIQASDQVGEMITHIATAATQQSSATEQVNSNMDQIAKLVQESAVGAQQSAKACGDLSNLALDLQALVGRFKLGDGREAARQNVSRRSSRVQTPPAMTRDFGREPIGMVQ